MRRDSSYQCFADLARDHAEGTDFRVCVQSRPGSSVAIIAPHGGAIEIGTSEVARSIAGDEFNLYLFEGHRGSGNYAALHLTSHRFDEPRCLELIGGCDHVLAIHGCRGDLPQVLVGGLDADLKSRVAEALAIHVDVRTTDHPFPAKDPQNICNRGRRGVGVQLELTTALRRGGVNKALIATIRATLAARQ
jgi:phage replication-related protein YjqB (UPF0714/DUF867 family)